MLSYFGEKYDSTIYTEEALHRLVEIHYFIGLNDEAQKYANLLGIDVHAGHGLDYKSARLLSNIKEISEFNIGHFIIGESIFDGLKKVIKK